MARAKSAPSDSSANLGFETKLRPSADKLRNNRDPAVTGRSEKQWRGRRPTSMSSSAKGSSNPSPSPQKRKSQIRQNLLQFDRQP